jgi:hypothetical protein
LDCEGLNAGEAGKEKCQINEFHFCKLLLGMCVLWYFKILVWRLKEDMKFMYRKTALVGFCFHCYSDEGVDVMVEFVICELHGPDPTKTSVTLSRDLKKVGGSFLICRYEPPSR